MDFKKVVLLFGALMVAAVTAIMAKNMFTGAGASQASAAPAVPVGPKVLVARKNLPAGTIIDATMLGFQPWPKELLEGAYYTQDAPDADPGKLLGTVVRHPITAGQPVTRGALVGPKDRGFLAAALGPGMRAVTVPVSAESGVAGFVFPGDRVDLVLTQEVKGEGPSLRVSETIVRNVRVLATDQRIDSKNEEGKIEVKTFENITLEATPRIAEKIAVAQSVGDLSLSLRSIADNTSELERAVASGEVKVPEGTNPADERRLLTAYANRPMDSNPTFTTGGHVSRFQRTSVPPQRLPQSNGGGEVRVAAVASPSAPSAPAAAVVTGPIVRISRGNSVTIVPVGAR
ncbi:MAG: Flp pilus assembly protein CpaB [Sphingomonas sp.]|nr:Flp pilus assembly protein CpaB [Sphingomonas sp.]